MCWNDEKECMKKKIAKMIEENNDVFENAFLKRYPTDVELEEAEKVLGIENCDEYVICIDIETGEIVSWSNYDKDGILKRAADFYEYFMECVDNAIENYD